MNNYSMPKYFQNMPTLGKPLAAANNENMEALKAIEADIHEAIKQYKLKDVLMNL